MNEAKHLMLKISPENIEVLDLKGQLISKLIHSLLTSPKKQTDKFVLFASLLFTANKSNSSLCYFGRIYGLPMLLDFI